MAVFILLLNSEVSGRRTMIALEEQLIFALEEPRTDAVGNRLWGPLTEVGTPS